MTINILYAWELGANLGHVGPFLPVARRLREKGYTLTLAIPPHSSAAQLLDAEGIAYVHVSSRTYEARNSYPLNYADMLTHFGYARHAWLLELTSAWRTLMQEVNPQIVLIDHAPTAILAAHTLQLKAMFFSTGFYVPPPQFPTPSLQPWHSISDKQLRAIERPVVATINSVLMQYKLPPIKGVAELFDLTDNTLLGPPVLDHYPQRPHAQYWGLLPDAGSGQTPIWPDGRGKRIFAYLRADNPNFQAMCTALNNMGQPTLVFCPDGQDTELVRTPAPHIAVSHSPVSLAQVVQESDVAITYGNFWTTTYFLQAGIPLLILPVYTEQYLLAKRIAGLGAAEAAEPDSTTADIHAMLERLLTKTGYSQNAQKFKHAYADHNPEETVERIVRRIEDLVVS